MQSNYMTGDPLSLERIRSTLIRLEDTIIFGLIERAQFAHNPRIYAPGAFQELEVYESVASVKQQLGAEADAGAETGKDKEKEKSVKGSWLDWFLRETEGFHGMQ